MYIFHFSKNSGSPFVVRKPAESKNCFEKINLKSIWKSVIMVQSEIQFIYRALFFCGIKPKTEKLESILIAINNTSLGINMIF